jgi:hypothetical protein
MFARGLRRESEATLHLARHAMHQADPAPGLLQCSRDLAEKLGPPSVVDRLSERAQYVQFFVGELQRRHVSSSEQREGDQAGGP